MFIKNKLPIMQLPFCKYSGCGNDFILIDNRNFVLPPKTSQFAKMLCHRHSGIGADGLILLENSESADFKMRIFNADGSEAEMCGNGIRCLYKFIEKLGFPSKKYCIETLQNQLTVAPQNQHVAVQMGSPSFIKEAIPLTHQGQEMIWHHMDTGVPHAISFLSDIEKIDVQTLGSFIRHHSHFAPQGTNVNLVKILSKNKIAIRTFERGVEDETLACGTGATAAALVSAKIHHLTSPIEVETRSKDTLKISFTFDPDTLKFSDVFMIGAADLVFEGIFHCQ